LQDSICLKYISINDLEISNRRIESMKSITVNANLFENIFSFLKANYSKVFSKSWIFNQIKLALFIHEEYVFRTGTYQTLTTIVEADPEFGTCTITAIGSGGGGGILNLDWGSESAGENTIIQWVGDLDRKSKSTEINGHGLGLQ
jgi:hypothetical protein